MIRIVDKLYNLGGVTTRRGLLTRNLGIMGVLSFLLLFNSCEWLMEGDLTFSKEKNEPQKTDGSKLSTLESYFLNGFTMELEQIYTMQGKNSIPFLDEPIEELFTSNQQVVNLPGFVVQDNYEMILCGLQRGDRWTFSKMNFVVKEHYIESGYGGTYLLRSYTTETPYNIIKSDNPYNALNFVTSIDLNGVNYRDGDDYQMAIQAYHNKNKQYLRSNLVLTVVSDLNKRKDNGIINGYIYLNTNAQVSVGYIVTPPLTGEMVRRIVDSGKGFDIYQWRGYNCIRIGSNLYIPTIGNTYRYIGTDNTNGMINGYVYKYYQLKFKILK
jgi:hypothetical protein